MNTLQDKINELNKVSKLVKSVISAKGYGTGRKVPGKVPFILHEMKKGEIQTFENGMEDQVRQSVRRENFKMLTPEFREKTWKVSVKGGTLTVERLY